MNEISNNNLLKDSDGRQQYFLQWHNLRVCAHVQINGLEKAIVFFSTPILSLLCYCVWFPRFPTCCTLLSTHKKNKQKHTSRVTKCKPAQSTRHTSETVRWTHTFCILKLIMIWRLDFFPKFFWFRTHQSRATSYHIRWLALSATTHTTRKQVFYGVLLFRFLSHLQALNCCSNAER